MYNAPYHVPLKEYEGMMANREYWDDLGAEWNWSSMEKKLVRLAGFVQQGGSLKKVLARYTKDRDEEYTNRIQFCILEYILKLMVGNRIKPYEKVPLVDRIKRLNKDEIVELLTKELKRDVVPSSEMDKNHKFHEHWRLLSDDEWLSDEILDKIEPALAQTPRRAFQPIFETVGVLVGLSAFFMVMDEKNVTLQIINKRRKFIMNKQIIITIQELLKGRDRNSDFDSAEEKRIKLVRHSGVIREDSVIGKDYYGQSVYELYRSNYPKFLEWQCEQNENKMKNVDYIVAFIGEEQCMCRFAGVYRNYGPKHKTLCGMFYDLKEVDGFEILKNQVVIDWGKGTLQWMQNWSTMKEVVRIDQVSDNEGIPYFTRYEDVSLNYSQLKQVVADNEWKTKLEACNCVYVITDKSNGKQYVGVTYKGSKAGAKGGILSRWTEYANSGHGEDVSLKKLCEGDSNYAEENFQWSILETLPLSVIPAIAINIETKWKEKLMTKVFGYNNN